MECQKLLNQEKKIATSAEQVIIIRDKHQKQKKNESTKSSG